MESELILKIRADTRELLKNIKAVTGEKIKLGVDSIKGTDRRGVAGTDNITQRALSEIKKAQERTMIEARKKEMLGTKDKGGFEKIFGGALSPVIKKLAPLIGITAIIGAVQSVNNRIKEMHNTLKEASPAMKASSRILEKIFSRVLKPMGDMLQSLMAPYMKIMLRRVREGMKEATPILKAIRKGEIDEEVGIAKIKEIYQRVMIDTAAMGKIMTLKIKPLIAEMEGFKTAVNAVMNTFLSGVVGWVKGFIKGLTYEKEIISPREMFDITIERMSPDEFYDLIVNKVSPKELYKIVTENITSTKLYNLLKNKLTSKQLYNLETGNLTPKELYKLLTEDLTPKELYKLLVENIAPDELYTLISRNLSPDELYDITVKDMTYEEFFKITILNMEITDFFRIDKIAMKITDFVNFVTTKIFGGDEEKQSAVSSAIKNIGNIASSILPGISNVVSNVVKSITSPSKSYTTKDIPSYLYKGGEFQGTISGKKVSEKEWAKDVAKSYQTGTPYVPETGLYELHRGERILNATENKEITPVLDKIKDFGTNLTTNNLKETINNISEGSRNLTNNLTTNNLNNFYNTKNITENIIKPVNIPLEFPSIPSNINKTENKTIEKKETKNITYNISLPSINITVNEMRNERDISELASQIGSEVLENIKNRVGS